MCVNGKKLLTILSNNSPPLTYSRTMKILVLLAKTCFIHKLVSKKTTIRTIAYGNIAYGNLLLCVRLYYLV